MQIHFCYQNKRINYAKLTLTELRAHILPTSNILIYLRLNIKY